MPALQMGTLQGKPTLYRAVEADKTPPYDSGYLSVKGNGFYRPPGRGRSGSFGLPYEPLLASSQCTTPSVVLRHQRYGPPSPSPSVPESHRSDNNSYTTHSSSAPSTPQMIRRKPPPKPPRMKSYYVESPTSPRNDPLAGSPIPSAGMESFKHSLAQVANSLNSLDTPIVGDGQMTTKSPEQLLKEKVYHILLQTREFLLLEINAENLLIHLKHTGVINEKTEQELHRSKTKQAMCELLLDVIMSKGHEEFLSFCDTLRKVGKEYLADLLLALDSLIETVTTTRKPRLKMIKGKKFADMSNNNENGSHEGAYEHDSQVSFFDNKVNGFDGCDLDTNDPDGDGANFDIEISYFDTELGHSKSIKDVTTLKKKKTQKTSTDDNFLVKAEHQNADRYIPVISVSLYNQRLCDEGLETLAKILEKYTCVRELSMVKNQIGVKGMRTLGKALQKNHSLLKLDIRLNTIEDEGASHLADGLRRNRSLRALNVTGTGLSGPGCNKLVDGLSRNLSLSELDVSFNDLRDTGCEVVANLLANNSPLKKLRMRDNSISPTGCSHIFKALRKNCRLCMLDMSSNKVDADSMSALAEMLLHNRTLRELNLENCSLAEDGCRALSRALKTNTVLKSLDLSMNPLENRGMSALSDGLKYNQVLDVMSLNMCGIGNQGFLTLLDSLRFNSAMRTIKLCYNNIGHQELTSRSEDLYEKLCQILQLNKDLKVLLWGNKLEEPKGTPALGQESAV